jgi:diguanylate cyclase (GGDEF)-like protein
VDVDHFKSVNDRFGHAVGDAALRTISGVLARGVRRGDAVARIGGEEFAVLLPGTDAAAAADLADAMGRHLAEMTAGRRPQLSISAGVAQLGGELANADKLMVAADRALYAAKGSGRARTAIDGAPDGARPVASRAPAAWYASTQPSEAPAARPDPEVLRPHARR